MPDAAGELEIYLTPSIKSSAAGNFISSRPTCQDHQSPHRWNMNAFVSGYEPKWDQVLIDAWHFFFRQRVSVICKCEVLRLWDSLQSREKKQGYQVATTTSDVSLKGWFEFMCVTMGDCLVISCLYKRQPLASRWYSSNLGLLCMKLG